MLLKQRTITSTQGADYVDLGLPSGLLWAKCNIGANEPTEYGDYFMWGSTKPDTDKPCNWEHAPFNDGCYCVDYHGFNEEYFNTVQNQVCPNGILAPEYDAAAVILGDDWRLPTVDEFQELIDNTKHEWINNYNDSKVNGILFQANDVELGTELFIPAAGYRGGYGFIDRGSILYLWSSSLYTDYPNSAYYFAAATCFSCYVYNDERSYGLCLRGVKEK